MTFETLKKCLPTAKDTDLKLFAGPLTTAMEKFEINTPRRQAVFLAQIAHESGNLSTLSENLNYSAQGLLGTFPNYFDAVTAKAYARQPEKIANHVYANRMGNGDEASGDGWRYRGRAPLQATGKDMYDRAGKALNYDLVKNPDALILPGAGSMVSAWIWAVEKNLNIIADKPDLWRGTRGKYKNLNYFDYTSVAINGGVHGLEDRRKKYGTIKQALGV